MPPHRLVPPLLTVTALLLSTCAATAPASPEASAQGLPARVASQAGQAATTPLGDLNLVKAEIPPVPLAASKAPDAVPAAYGCFA